MFNVPTLFHGETAPSADPSTYLMPLTHPPFSKSPYMSPAALLRHDQLIRIDPKVSDIETLKASDRWLQAAVQRYGCAVK
jgi:hypothetical protein